MDGFRIYSLICVFVNFQTIITIGMFNTSVFFSDFQPNIEPLACGSRGGASQGRRVQGVDTQNGVLVGLSRHPTMIKT